MGRPTSVESVELMPCTCCVLRVHLFCLGALLELRLKASGSGAGDLNSDDDDLPDQNGPVKEIKKPKSKAKAKAKPSATDPELLAKQATGLR